MRLLTLDDALDARARGLLTPAQASDFAARFLDPALEEWPECEVDVQERQIPDGPLRIYRELRAADDSDDPEYKFIASDETEDRYGDVIKVSGWQLQNYKKNPIVLFGHRDGLPIGQAKAWKENGALMASIKLDAAGTDETTDMVRAKLKSKTLRTVSVGFLPLARPDRLEDDEGRFTGFKFIKQELLEISVVSVPANPNATQVRELGLTRADVARLFDIEPDAVPADAPAHPAHRLAHKQRRLDLLRLAR